MKNGTGSLVYVFPLLALQANKIQACQRVMYLPKKLLTLLLKQLPRLLEWQFFCKSKTFAKFLTVKNELH